MKAKNWKTLSAISVIIAVSMEMGEKAISVTTHSNPTNSISFDHQRLLVAENSVSQKLTGTWSAIISGSSGDFEMRYIFRPNGQVAVYGSNDKDLAQIFQYRVNTRTTPTQLDFSSEKISLSGIFEFANDNEMQIGYIPVL